MFNSMKFNQPMLNAINVPAAGKNPISLSSFINSADKIELTSAIDSAGIISLESNLN